MAIYNGRETLEITDQDAWSSIECGTTIFMNIVLVRLSSPRDNSRKFSLDWYVMMILTDDVPTYLLIAGIVAGNCKVNIKLILALTGHR